MAAGDITASLVSTIRTRIGDPGGVTVQTSELYGYLNEAQMVLAMEEGLDNALLPLTRTLKSEFDAPAWSQVLPADFLRERYVSVGGVVAKRMSVLEMDAVRANAYYEASPTNPFYAIRDGKLQFFLGGTAPTYQTYELYYVRKPMRVRNISTWTTGESGGVTTTLLTTTVAHGLKDADAGEVLYVEDTSDLDYNGAHALLEETSTTQIRVAGEITGVAGTSPVGRIVFASWGQVAADEDPLVPKIMYGLMMDWAVMRCREQMRHFDERNRQRAHFYQRVEALKRRYGSAKRPFDNIPGDPGVRVPAGG